ncbi:MAG: 50S ribosomal protein L11 methyltransferase [Deltaproteobacteria bacterium]|nr:50S ribosomal protein L11 methyltransferase [Deltaproteobacteria bacterium]
MPLITQNGFDFAFDPAACDQCRARCCRGEAGQVWVTPDEIKDIAHHLGLEVHAFLKDYLVTVGNRFSIKELRIKGDLECALLDADGRRCTVYPVRPGQCRTYPFWNCFKANPAAAQAECPGVRPLKTQWVEIILRIPGLWVEALAPLLEDLGLTGVWIEEENSPPFRTVVRAYIAEKRWSAELEARVHNRLRQLGQWLPAERQGPAVEKRLIEDQDWAAAWLPFFEPIKVGSIWIRPSAKPVHLSRNEREVIVDPGQAFGTGHHETTRLCLESIQALRPLLNDEAAILDLGTGTGILAMVAAALGFTHITATDTDPVAVETARHNIRLNAMGPLIRVSGTPLEKLPGRFDLILANLSASAIMELHDRIAAHLAPRGWLVVSGVLTQQADPISRSITRKGLRLTERKDDQGWACLIFRAPMRS